MSDSTVVANNSKVVEVTRKSLPLHCPGDQSPLWAMHPRVFLPLAADRTAKCPYCGTLYRVKD